MCGITGIVSLEERLDLKDRIQSMTEALYLRGPDSQGYFIGSNMSLGHRRLAIIDLENGGQPIYNEDQSIVVVLNGEIYNFKELRQMLQDKGHQFTTQTDTEVIVHAYEEWGIEKTLDCLDGMFAIGLHDTKLKKTIFARDKFGEKPLYYFQDDAQTLYVGSELKALETQGFTKEISKEGLNLFLSLSYIPAPYTIYEKVYKLDAGHYLEISGRQIFKHCYYALEDHIEPSGLSFEEACQKLQMMLNDSVKSRMVSDVPVGAFLSGGIDSSIVVALMSKHSNESTHTFSIGFKEKEFNESDRAQIVAETYKTKHTLHYLEYADVLEILDDIILYFDEPYGDSSAIPSFYVAKLAREKVKVVLTGDCADELFGGYEKYLAEYYSKRYIKIPKLLRQFFEATIRIIPHNAYTNKPLRKIKKLICNASTSGFESSFNYMCIGCSDDDRKSLLQTEYYRDIKPIVKKKYDLWSHSDELNKSMFSDVKTVLEGDMFPKVDRVCMMNSLENRPPFLDTKIVEFALSLPSAYKVNGKIKKHIVKEAFRTLLPKEIFKYRKSGFDVPIGDWFKRPLKEELLLLISNERLSKQGIFNAEKIAKIAAEHLANRGDHSTLLWNLFVFQKWHNKHGN